MPGIVGGLGGVFSAASAGSSAYGSSISEIFPARGEGRTAGQQGLYQFFALITTIAFASVFGALTGALLKSPLFHQEHNAFSDESHWLLESDDEEGKPANDVKSVEEVGLL